MAVAVAQRAEAPSVGSGRASREVVCVNVNPSFRVSVTFLLCLSESVILSLCEGSG